MSESPSDNLPEFLVDIDRLELALKDMDRVMEHVDSLSPQTRQQLGDHIESMAKIIKEKK